MTTGSIILHDICVTGNLVEYFFEVTGSAQQYFNGKVFFCEYDEPMDDVPKSILSIPFVGSLVALAWLNNWGLWVDELDRTYYDSLKWVKWAYQEMYDKVNLSGRLIPSKFIDNAITYTHKKILLFGGGIDAHASFIRHYDDISHIINIQGWFSTLQSIDEGANADKAHCQVVANENKKSFKYVRSNFACIVKNSLINKKFKKVLKDEWWHAFLHAMAFISITIPIAYKLNISNILIGSSLTVGANYTCASYITTDSEFKYARNGMTIHDAFELSRQQKASIIVAFQKHANRVYPLKVCSFNDCNCCACEKCFRSIIEIVAEGGNPLDFGFNIHDSLKEHWQRVIDNRLALWAVESENEKYWRESASAMRQNYDKIIDKEFVDWFLTYDFIGQKKKKLYEYYRTNFFSILKRKLHLFISKESL